MELELESNRDWDRTEHEEVVQLDQNWPGTGTGSHKYAINLNNMHQYARKYDKYDEVLILHIFGKYALPTLLMQWPCRGQRPGLSVTESRSPRGPGLGLGVKLNLEPETSESESVAAGGPE